MLVGSRLLAWTDIGEVVLADFDREGLRVIGRAPLLEEKAWGAPALVGSTLYVRDERRIVAADLGGVR